MNDQFNSELSELEKEIGVQPGFFEGLIHEDSWSFVIKTCAFFQTLIAQTLSLQLGRPELFPELSNLPFAESKAGLITMAEKIGAIDKQAARTLTKLAQIRNHLAHDVTFSSFDWVLHFKSLDTQQRLSFRNAFAYWAEGQEGSPSPKLNQDLSKHPQFFVHKSCFLIVVGLHLACSKAKLEKIQNERGRELLERQPILGGQYGQLMALLESKQEKKKRDAT
jgi:hypothetical protein